MSQLGDDMFQMDHGGDDHLDHVAILSGDMMAFHDFAQGMGDRRQALVVLAGYLEMNEGKNRVPQLRWIQYGPIAGYKAMILHTPDALGDRWRG